MQDDTEEWALEAPKMASIYNGAIVTISATSAVSGHDGLFNTKSSRALSHDSGLEIAIETRLLHGGRSVLRFGRQHSGRTMLQAWRANVLDAPLLQRAWVCQERMSSPRIIHYTSAQIFWECEHCMLSEDNIIVSSETASSDRKARSFFLTLYSSMILKNWGWHHWYAALVEYQYSRCNLTFKQDKLIAISGLAKLINDKTTVPYFAGHWYSNEHEFLNSLYWARESAGVKTCDYRAPSWSWASQDSATGFYVDNNESYHSRIMHLYVEPKAPATSSFGLLSGGGVVVEGPLLSCRLEYVSYTSRTGLWSNAGTRYTNYHLLDNDTEPPIGTIAQALALTSGRNVYFLILSTVEHDTCTMKRIGLGIINVQLDWAQQLLRAPLTRVRII